MSQIRFSNETLTHTFTSESIHFCTAFIIPSSGPDFMIMSPCQSVNQQTNRAPNEPARPIGAQEKHILVQKWPFSGQTY